MRNHGRWSLCGGRWLCLAGLALIPAAGMLAGDQPEWGQRFTRNMVSGEKNLPEAFDPASGKNVRWNVALGTQVWSSPIIAGGRVFIGTNNELPRDPEHKGDCGVLLCLDEKDGSLKWQLIVPKLEDDQFLDWPKTGWCSPVTVEGNRVYTVTNRAEVVCLDLDGMANGNDGPYKNEASHMMPRGVGEAPVNRTDGDILWLFDMPREAGTWPHDGAQASILVDGPFLYVNTNNGVDNTHRTIRRPEAPCLIVLEKATGRLIARDDEKIGDRIVHNTWSSPAIGDVNGKRTVIFAGPDGVVYGFDALKEVPPPGTVVTLRKRWWFDCDPEAPKTETHKYMGNRKISPSTILGMPVLLDNKVYVAAGGDIWWGKRKSWLQCIDATKEGDVTQSAKLWSYEMPSHCVSTPSIADGLIYIPDCGRNVHCVDQKTGQNVWTHKTAGDMYGSVLCADGKLYIGNRRGEFYILQAGREIKVLCQVDLGAAVNTSATVANGTVYIATMNRLWAVGK